MHVTALTVNSLLMMYVHNSLSIQLPPPPQQHDHFRWEGGTVERSISSSILVFQPNIESNKPPHTHAATLGGSPTFYAPLPPKEERKLILYITAPEASHYFAPPSPPLLHIDTALKLQHHIRPQNSIHTPGGQSLLQLCYSRHRRILRHEHQP